MGLSCCILLIIRIKFKNDKIKDRNEHWHNKEDRLAIAAGLQRLLADTYTLYLQTHNSHWNVTSLQLREFHLMFEEHYTELAISVDDIVERI